MKKYKILIVVLASLGVLIGYSFMYPEVIGLCDTKDVQCIYGFPNLFGEVLFLLCLPILFVSLVSFFLQAEIFKSWVKFSAWFILLSIFLISLAPEYTADIIAPFDKEVTTWWMASIFFLISLLIIGIKSWKLRRK